MKHLNRKTRVVTFICLGVLCTLGAYIAAAQQNQPQASQNGACLHRYVALSSGEKSVTVATELALTQPQRERGLMFRRTLGQNEGMLFFWPQPTQIFMWMKNTYIPLDMIFMRQGEVVGIIHAEKTENTTPLTIPHLADQILEVNLGFSQTHGITPGWKATLGACIQK